MRAVVGKPETETPRFSTYVDKVILYPYWVMPRSILVNEWLAAFRKKPALIRQLGMEVLDAKGRVIEPSSINWSRLNARNFPYTIREETGCQNPLGVIKFHLSGPFDVYFHDTNFKGAFLARNRFYSHGCIRIQNPVGLANALLPQPVDEPFLQACFKDQKPITISIPKPVPAFVVYMPAEVNAAGEVEYFSDIYKLLP
jgi:murein L,D-transpeptidase YcbB/YkuD